MVEIVLLGRDVSAECIRSRLIVARSDEFGERGHGLSLVALGGKCLTLGAVVRKGGR